MARNLLEKKCPRLAQRRHTSLSAAPCEGLTRVTSGRPADLGHRKLACRLLVLYGRGQPDCSNRRSTESTPAYSVWSRAACAASSTPALRRAVLYAIQRLSTAARPRASPAQGTWPRANCKARSPKLPTTCVSESPATSSRARGAGGGGAGGDAVRCDGAGPVGAAAVAGCVTGRDGGWARGCGGAGVGGARRSLALSADTFPLIVDVIADHLR